MLKNFLNSLFLIACTGIAFAQSPYDAYVVSISDGDTVTVLTDEKKQVKIRLSEIDAPEIGQPWGKNARKALSAIVFNKTVRISPVVEDKYGRTVAKIFLGDDDINREMIATGNAWVYRKYMTDESLLGLEARARETNLGLWQLPENERMPPWCFRYTKRECDYPELQ